MAAIRRCTAASAVNLVEALEPRTLMAADLTGSLGAMPASVVAGEKTTVVVQVSNDGDTDARKIGVSLYLSQDDQLDGSDTLIAAGKANGKLRAGGSRHARMKVTLPADTVAGAYRLIAVVDSADTTAESDETNNTIVSEEISVAGPDVNLAAALRKFHFARPLVAGDALDGKLQLYVTNTGTTKLANKQPIDIQVYARPVDATDDSQDVLVGTRLGKRISNLGAGRTKLVNVKLTLPADLPAGDYRLVAVIDTGNHLAETDETDNATELSEVITLAELVE